MKLLQLMILLLLVPFAANAQSSKHHSAKHEVSPIRIITSAPSGGTRYYITIVPIDSTNIDKMPMAGMPKKGRDVRKFQPEKQKLLLWDNSLEHLLSDSGVKFLQDDLTKLKLK